MKHFYTWKRIAICLLFVNILLSGFYKHEISEELGEQPSIQRMSFSPNLILGPGSKLFNGGSLSLLADEENRQMLSMVIQAKDGTLIVIDGGWDTNSAHLLDVIRAKGGRVSGWFITHPHSDHVGALIRILNHPDSQITIDNVYYSLADQSFYDAKEPSRSDFVKSLRSALATLPAEKLHSNLKKGQEIQLGEIRIVVMNEPYLLDTTSVNNSSVSYKIFLNGISILALGDMGPEGGQRFLSEHTADELRSDIVQMAHHGQYGVGRDVYAAIRPEIALWPCPLWLWNNDNGGGIGSGDWKTLETRRWTEELGVRLNYSIKDGDQIIN